MGFLKKALKKSVGAKVLKKAIKLDPLAKKIVPKTRLGKDLGMGTKRSGNAAGRMSAAGSAPASAVTPHTPPTSATPAARSGGKGSTGKMMQSLMGKMESRIKAGKR